MRKTWMLIASCFILHCHKSNVILEKSTAPALSLKNKIIIDHPDARGLSGLDTFSDGFVAVTERSRSVFIVDHDRNFTKLPIQGYEGDVDLEGIATLDDSRRDSSHVVFSTEGSDSHDYEEIWVGQVNADNITISSKHQIPKPKEWAFGDNNGLEGICVTEESLWVVAEIDFTNNGQRSAGVARIERKDFLSSSKTHPTWYVLPLTSAKGKISALDCRFDGTTTTFWAIERHFGVSRVIEFKHSNQESHSKNLASFPVFELVDIDKKIPNFEGIVRINENEWAIINDNEYASIDGQTFLWLLK